MKKSEIRFTVPSEIKAKIKIEAIKKGVPLNRYIYDLIKDSVPGVEIMTGKEMMEKELMEKELDDVLKRLANSAELSAEERSRLKQRKEELKRALAK